MRTLRFFVATGSAASAVTVGLYTDVNGHPGALLTRGTLAAPVANFVERRSGPAGRVYYPCGAGAAAVLGDVRRFARMR